MTYHKAKLAYAQAYAKGDYVKAIQYLESAIDLATDDMAILGMKSLHRDLREMQPRKGLSGAWMRLRGVTE